MRPGMRPLKAANRTGHLRHFTWRHETEELGPDKYRITIWREG